MNRDGDDERGQREYLHVRPAKEARCEVHDWPTAGMPRRLVEAMRACHGRGGIDVCRECVDRAKSEADRERQAVTP